MFANLTPLNLIVLFSTTAAFLGTFTANIVRIILENPTKKENKFRWIKDATLASVAMSLYAGGLTLEFSFYNIESVANFTPRHEFIFIFSVCFFSPLTDIWIKAVKHLLSKVSRWV